MPSCANEKEFPPTIHVAVRSHANDAAGSRVRAGAVEPEIFVVVYHDKMNWDATRLIDVLVVPLLGSVRTKGVQPSRATDVDRSIGADGRNLFLVVTALAQGSRTASGEFPFLCACGPCRRSRHSGTAGRVARFQKGCERSNQRKRDDRIAIPGHA